MLVLTRKKDESIIISDNIEITIVDIGESRVRVGINAPKDIRIIRKEMLDQTIEENKNSLNNINNLEVLKELNKNSDK